MLSVGRASGLDGGREEGGKKQESGLVLVHY